jgi:hypothetical protein
MIDSATIALTSLHPKGMAPIQQQRAARIH